MQPTADYWTIDQENLGLSQGCVIFYEQKSKGLLFSFKTFWIHNKAILLNLAFTRYEEFCRSPWVLSLLDLQNPRSYPTQPCSIIAKYILSMIKLHPDLEKIINDCKIILLDVTKRLDTQLNILKQRCQCKCHNMLNVSYVKFLSLYYYTLYTQVNIFFNLSVYLIAIIVLNNVALSNPQA